MLANTSFRFSVLFVLRMSASVWGEWQSAQLIEKLAHPVPAEHPSVFPGLLVCTDTIGAPPTPVW
jgi:hypothetical protein